MPILLILFIIVPAPIFILVSITDRMVGFAQVKHAFPDQRLPWWAVGRSTFLLSLDGSTTIWRIPGDEEGGASSSKCIEEKAWDGTAGADSRDVCLVGRKLVCESDGLAEASVIEVHRDPGSGRLLARRDTGDAYWKCVVSGLIVPETPIKCTNEIIARLDSPAGDMAAYIFTRSCGRYWANTLNLSTMPRGKPPGGPGNVMIQDGWGKTRTFKPEWQGARLVVRYDPSVLTIRRRNLIDGVEVSYVKKPSEPLSE